MVDAVSEIENALGAEVLRAKLLGRDPPKLGGRYVVESILGRGASGLVVSALDDRLNRPVALKLRPAEGDTAMLAEARTLARLDHPNVVRVHDVDVVRATMDGREFKLWLVSMARIEGRTMRAWLREQGRSPGEVLAVCTDVARGLAVAHEAYIVHRDVKPDNVIVRNDGAAQILDFGFAVQAASTQSDVGAGRPAAGTDPYMSPEARLGQTSRKSDQYSLGVTMVEALSGSPIPAGRRPPRGVPAPVWSIAQRATAPDPHDRFGDMKAMLAELVRVAQAPASSRSRWVIPVTVIVTVAVAVVFYATIRPDRSDATNMAGAHASRPPVAEVRGSDETDVAGGSGSADGTADVDGGSGSAASPDFAATSSPPEDAGACRVPRAGARTFHTVRAHGGAPGRSARGTYEIGLDVRRRQLRDVRLARTAPGRDTLHVRSFAFVGDCELHLKAHAENRDYEFWLRIDGERVLGRFEAMNDRSQSDFGGTVEPAEP